MVGTFRQRLTAGALPIAGPALLLVAGMGVATHSVVRYRLWIVAVYALLAGLLALWVARRTLRPAGPTVGWGLAATFALVAVLHLTVRPYSYLTADQGWTVRSIQAGSALLVGALLLAATRTGRHQLADAGLGVAVLGYLAAAALLITLDPAPRIDVWVTLQQAADGLRHGENMYAQNWTGSPGVQDAFTYLPFTGLLLAPGRWLAGDVRWALVVITLLGVLAVQRLGAPLTTSIEGGASSPPTAASPSAVAGSVQGRSTAAGVAALLLLLPGTATQVEQAWTEPLLMACLAGWALGVQRVGVHRRGTLLAVLCLALGLASKQHLAVLLPVLAAWPRFGPRRTAAAALLAGLFVLPWFAASPADFWHDTVTILVGFQPLVFADTLYIAAINDLSWTPPFWLTGAAVLTTLVTATVAVYRRDPDLAGVLRWFALILFVANLVNKQAFYNQYWLVAALVVISLAVPAGARKTTAGYPDPVPAGAAA